STAGGVNLWQLVVVQPAISSSSAIGRPTWLLTPTMVALCPRTGRSVQASSVVIPRGVQGRRPNWRSARWPTFSGWNPSTSLRGSMRWIRRLASGMPGNGSCTRMPWTDGSALSRSMSASSSDSLVPAGRSWSRAWMPTFSAARRLLRTYTDEAGSSPTSTTASPGRAFPAATRASTRALSESSSSPAMRLPSRMRAVCWECAMRCGRACATVGPTLSATGTQHVDPGAMPEVRAPLVARQRRAGGGRGGGREQGALPELQLHPLQCRGRRADRPALEAPPAPQARAASVTSACAERLVVHVARERAPRRTDDAARVGRQPRFPEAHRQGVEVQHPPRERFADAEYQLDRK